MSRIQRALLFSMGLVAVLSLLSLWLYRLPTQVERRLRERAGTVLSDPAGLTLERCALGWGGELSIGRVGLAPPPGFRREPVVELEAVRILDHDHETLNPPPGQFTGAARAGELGALAGGLRLRADRLHVTLEGRREANTVVWNTNGLVRAEAASLPSLWLSADAGRLSLSAPGAGGATAPRVETDLLLEAIELTGWLADDTLAVAGRFRDAASGAAAPAGRFSLAFSRSRGLRRLEAHVDDVDLDAPGWAAGLPGMTLLRTTLAPRGLAALELHAAPEGEPAATAAAGSRAATDAEGSGAATDAEGSGAATAAAGSGAATDAAGSGAATAAEGSRAAAPLTALVRHGESSLGLPRSGLRLEHAAGGTTRLRAGEVLVGATAVGASAPLRGLVSGLEATLSGRVGSESYDLSLDVPRVGLDSLALLPDLGWIGAVLGSLSLRGHASVAYTRARDRDGERGGVAIELDGARAPIFEELALRASVSGLPGAVGDGELEIRGGRVRGLGAVAGRVVVKRLESAWRVELDALRLGEIGRLSGSVTAGPGGIRGAVVATDLALSLFDGLLVLPPGALQMRFVAVEDAAWRAELAAQELGPARLRTRRLPAPDGVILPAEMAFEGGRLSAVLGPDGASTLELELRGDDGVFRLRGGLAWSTSLDDALVDATAVLARGEAGEALSRLATDARDLLAAFGDGVAGDIVPLRLGGSLSRPAIQPLPLPPREASEKSVETPSNDTDLDAESDAKSDATLPAAERPAQAPKGSPPPSAEADGAAPDSERDS